MQLFWSNLLLWKMQNQEIGRSIAGTLKYKFQTVIFGFNQPIICVNSIKDSSIVFTDKSTSYVDIADYVEVHVSEVSNEVTTNTTLKWGYFAIANVKRSLLGIYHKIKGTCLQNYLDEFCYKLNRRNFGEKCFDRLTLAVAKIYLLNNGYTFNFDIQTN